MSGSNGYFLNLAGQNLAAQGASIGFSGLNVVGTTSLIGALYATGGINSQGITTTNAIITNMMTGGNSYFNRINVQYSNSTGSAGIVTSNTTRGNLMIPFGQMTGTVNNSLVNSDTFISAVCSQYNQLNPITFITSDNGSFTVYLTGNAALDIYLKWMVIN